MFCNVARTIALAATVIAALPAVAKEPAVEISYADLDLSSAHGRKALDRRIARAADRLCGFADPRDIATLTAKQRCIVDTVATARPTVDLAHRSANSGGTRLAR